MSLEHVLFGHKAQLYGMPLLLWHGWCDEESGYWCQAVPN